MFGLSEWLRTRLLRWLAHGGEGVTVRLEGAHHVTVSAAGVVRIDGGYIVAKSCKVAQDSAGENLERRAERVRPAPNAATQDAMREARVIVGRRRIKRNWQEHNAGSVVGEEN